MSHFKLIGCFTPIMVIIGVLNYQHPLFFDCFSLPLFIWSIQWYSNLRLQLNFWRSVPLTTYFSEFIDWFFYGKLFLLLFQFSFLSVIFIVNYFHIPSDSKIFFVSNNNAQFRVNFPLKTAIKDLTSDFETLIKKKSTCRH